MPLTKADKSQCQADVKQGSFMTFGPRRWKRCPNKPVYIAKEKKPPKGKKNRGSMSLCEDCKDAFLQIKGSNFATLKLIEPPPKGV